MLSAKKLNLQHERERERERERDRERDLWICLIQGSMLVMKKRKPEFCNNKNKTPREKEKGRAKGTWNRYEKEEQQ
jgi:hypothetical protein